MSKSKINQLRELQNQIENSENQPIYSKEEKKKLNEAKSQIERAIHIAQKSKAKEDGGHLHLYEDQHVAELHGHDLGLTLTEFELLHVLHDNASKAFTRKKLLDRVWDDHMLVTERTVDAYIRNLREKLGDYSDCIETVRGVGYRFNEEPVSISS
jgi:DNA-binding response OmpR family regulator